MTENTKVQAFTESAAWLCVAFDRYADARSVMPTTVLQPLEDLVDNAIAAEVSGDRNEVRRRLAVVKAKIAEIRQAHSTADEKFALARTSIERAAASIMEAFPPRENLQ
jgi:hypothetical protein